MSEPMIPLSQVLVYEVTKLGTFKKRRKDADAKMLQAHKVKAARRAANPARTILASIRQVVKARPAPHIREVFC